MARIKCKQCGKKYGNSLNECPHCGCSVKKQFISTGSLLRSVIPFFVGVVVTIGVVWFISSKSVSESESDQRAPERRLTFGDLLAFDPSTQTCSWDIAEINLLCAQGLPGAEDLDVEKCLKTIDEWVPWVKHETDRHLYRFYRNPEQYRNSEGLFRMLMLAQVLGEDMGIGYNMDLVTSGIMADTKSTRFYRDSRDILIHGLLSDWKKGTCSTFPTLIAAVGRRLGYPVRLAESSGGHVFCRWESPDGKEKFNFDSQGKGWDSKSDEFYRNWPRRATKAEMESEGYLKTLSPAEELGVFLQLRGYCLVENDRLIEAHIALVHAHRLMPKSKTTLWHLGTVMEKEFEGKFPRKEEYGKGKALMEFGDAAMQAQREAARLLQRRRNRDPLDPTPMPPIPADPSPFVPNPAGGGFQPSGGHQQVDPFAPNRQR